MKNWSEFKGIFTDILANEGFTNSLLTKEFRQLKQKAKANGQYVHSTFGLCYVLSECAYHMLGGKEEGWTPMHVKHLGCSHWFLKHESDFILDLSEEQFNAAPDYNRARGKGFMTKNPCKRSLILMGRLRDNLQYINKQNDAPATLDAQMDDLILNGIKATPTQLKKISGDGEVRLTTWDTEDLKYGRLYNSY